MYNSATAYGKRPSDFMQFETEIAAWALDEACLVLGRRFENMLNEGMNPFGNNAPAAKGYASAPKGKIKKVKNGNSIR